MARRPSLRRSVGFGRRQRCPVCRQRGAANPNPNFFQRRLASPVGIFPGPFTAPATDIPDDAAVPSDDVASFFPAVGHSATYEISDLSASGSPESIDGGGGDNQRASLRNLVRDLAAKGAVIHAVIQGGDLVLLYEERPEEGILEEYFSVFGFKVIIQLLLENDPNPNGTLPAAASAVAALPAVSFSEGLQEAQCVVCISAFEVGEDATQMPCGHIYHKDCILSWLKLCNSCPVCRYQLPTDDSDQRVDGGDEAGANSGGPYQRTARRRSFTVWLAPLPSSPAAGSPSSADAGAADDSGGNPHPGSSGA